MTKEMRKNYTLSDELMTSIFDDINNKEIKLKVEEALPK